MNKIVVLGLLFVVGCSAAKPEVKTIENVAPEPSVDTVVQELNPLSEEIIIQIEEYDEMGNIKVFSCRGCHIQCRHCVE